MAITNSLFGREEDERNSFPEDIVRSVAGAVILGKVGLKVYEGYKMPHVRDMFKDKYRAFSGDVRKWIESKDMLRSITGFKSGAEDELKIMQSTFYNPSTEEIVKPSSILSSKTRGIDRGISTTTQIREARESFVNRTVLSKINRLEDNIRKGSYDVRRFQQDLGIYYRGKETGVMQLGKIPVDSTKAKNTILGINLSSSHSP